MSITSISVADCVNIHSATSRKTRHKGRTTRTSGINISHPIYIECDIDIPYFSNRLLIKVHKCGTIDKTGSKNNRRHAFEAHKFLLSIMSVHVQCGKPPYGPVKAWSALKIIWDPHKMGQKHTKNSK